MKKYSILIADDEEPAHIILQEYCQSLAWVGDIFHAYDGLEAFQMLQKKAVDILLLDIEMPKMTGLEMAEQLKNPPVIILTTAYPEFALDGYRIEALDYLLKPIPVPRFIESMDRAKSKVDEKLGNNLSADQPREYIWLRADKVDHKVSLNAIKWIEADDDYVKVHTTEHSKPLMVHGRISAMVGEINHPNIIQVHRSYAINTNHVKAVEGNQVKIDDQYIAVGTTYRDVLKKLF